MTSHSKVAIRSLQVEVLPPDFQENPRLYPQHFFVVQKYYPSLEHYQGTFLFVLNQLKIRNQQPLNDLSPSQTQPQPLLHFSINEDGQSINKRHYHAISSKDLVKLNRYAPTLQQAANWYLNELADSKIYYFYQQNDSIQTLQVLFDKDKFQHLTGVFPYKEGQSAEQTLEDFANGNGAFDTILLANKGAAFDKLKVLPELPAIVESDSFYFGDLSEVPKLHSLDLDKAIKSGDEDII